MSDTSVPPPLLTLKQAAEAIGRSKQTVLRAIQAGKISAQKDEGGEWRIQASELFRVYAPGTGDGTADEGLERDAPDGVIAQYQVRIETLEAYMERERRQYEDTINDLRRRLDSSEEERRRKDQQLTALLTDQRKREEEAQAKAAEPPPPPPKGLLRRLFRG
jgi:excisionase family DNA binding protein